MKTTKETIREYDKDGNLIKEIVRETTENNDNHLERHFGSPSNFFCNGPDAIIACYSDDLK